MPEAAAPIYHVAPVSSFRRDRRGETYAPASLAAEGFVHCTATPATLLRVADDYFGGCGEPLVLLALDPARLVAPVRLEAPATAPGAGRAHLASGERFPHVYGPVNLDAVTGAALLARTDGAWRWPAALVPLDALLGWCVRRRDEHGTEFEVEDGLDERSARARVAELESRGHKQSYFAVAPRTTGAGPGRR